MLATSLAAFSRCVTMYTVEKRCEESQLVQVVPAAAVVALQRRGLA